MVEDLRLVASRPGSDSHVCSLESAESRDRNIPNQLSVVRRFRYLRSLIRQLVTFDILHLVFFPASCSTGLLLLSVVAAKFLGKKVVLDYRGSVLPVGAIDKTLFGRLWRVCDRVLVSSPFQQQLVNSTGGRAEYNRPTVDVDSIEHRIISNVQPRLVVVSELERVNDVASVIRAYRLVKQKYPRTELLVVGSGSQESILKRMVSVLNLPGVTFSKSLDKKGRWESLERSDVYINCSMLDSLSLATVEAFAFGLPVLTTPLSGGNEPFRSRDNIVLLAYNDHAGLAQRIIELAEDDQLTEQLSRRSRQTAERHRPLPADEQRSRMYGRLAQKRD